MQTKAQQNSLGASDTEMASPIIEELTETPVVKDLDTTSGAGLGISSSYCLIQYQL